MFSRIITNVRYRIPSSTSKSRHIFIVGVPRSGTTLLKSVLCAHSKLGGSDWESTGIFGVRDIFQYHLKEVDNIDTLLANNTDIIAFYDRVANVVLDHRHKQTFVDKIQVRLYRLWYITKYFPEAKFIHIVRDGRDAYCSALKHPNVIQSTSVRSWAKYWRRSVTLPERTVSEDRLYTIRYEDLTTATETTVSGIMNFLDLEFESTQIQVEGYSSTSTMKARSVHANLARSINAQSQERWRQELTDEENRLFCRIAGKELAKFGYPAD